MLSTTYLLIILTYFDSKHSTSNQHIFCAIDVLNAITEVLPSKYLKSEKIVIHLVYINLLCNRHTELNVYILLCN